MKRSPLKRKTGLSPGSTPLKHTKGLAKKSEKRRAEDVIYFRRRREYLAINPLCQWPGCHCLATDIHHTRGRDGALYLDVTWFRGLCRTHHRRAHDYPLEAKELKVSFSRLEKIEP